jgi:hypothetical protein
VEVAEGVIATISPSKETLRKEHLRSRKPTERFWLQCIETYRK